MLRNLTCSRASSVYENRSTNVFSNHRSGWLGRPLDAIAHCAGYFSVPIPEPRHVERAKAGMSTANADPVECIVVGAGAVGLAVARALARAGREVVIVESEPCIGSGVSSRNSCVIHAGIYYAKGSLKARVCVAGKHALYEFCAAHGVAHDRIGKLIVATDASQLDALDDLVAKAADNGVDDLQRLSQSEAKRLEPAVECVGALLSPSTGIIDAHEYMLALLGDAQAHGAMLALKSPFVRGEALGDGLEVEIGGDEPMRLRCEWLVNCAALGAQRVATSIRGLDARHVPPLYYAKGNYYCLTGRSPFKRLIYPMPSDSWLGVHSSVDLGGRCRFGPDMHWVDELDYDVELARSEVFYDAIRTYWPSLKEGGLLPDYTGIRPKLTPAGVTALDFKIQPPSEHGVPGLVNLFGIESPGLTSSLAIGDYVLDLTRAEGESVAA